LLDTTNYWRCSFFKAKFSPEEKIQVVRQYLNGNEGGKTIAKSIGVHPTNRGHNVNHKKVQRIMKELCS
jgi:transposase-like protein